MRFRAETLDPHAHDSVQIEEASDASLVTGVHGTIESMLLTVVLDDNVERAVVEVGAAGELA